MDNKSIFEILACMPGKTKVSARLVACTVELLENIDCEDLPPDCMQLYGYVLHAFSMKKAKLESRRPCARLSQGQDAQGCFDRQHMHCRLQAGDDGLLFDRK